MERVKLLRTVYWVFFAATFIILYYSLRYAGDQAMEFTFLALAFWGAAFFLNRYIKKINSAEENDADEK